MNTAIHFPHELGSLVSLIGQNDFANRFCATADRILGIDFCTAFVKEKTGSTGILLAESPKGQHSVRELANRYVAGAYTHDPIWHEMRHLEQGPCVPVLLTPSDVRDAGYREDFYTRPNIKQEMAVTAASSEGDIYLAFYRENGRPSFSPEALELMQATGDFFVRILYKHAEITHKNRPVDQAQKSRMIFERIYTALRQENCMLTHREAEVCAMIAIGYSVGAIALNLSISENTVATHRKRSYAKLHISRQNELFARYIDCFNLEAA